MIGNHFDRNANAISLGGLRGNGATDNLIAENKITGNEHGWWCNNALVGNHVLTSDTSDENYLEGSKCLLRTIYVWYQVHVLRKSPIRTLSH